MKPILKRPRYGLTSAATWSMIIGVLVTGIFIWAGMHPAYLILSSLYLLIGIFIWQEQRWAIWMGFVVYGLGFVARAIGLVIAFEVKDVFMGLFFGFTAYECWNALKLMNEPPDLIPGIDDVESNEGDDDDERPMISFVLLQRTGKFLEDMVLARIIESAWGGDYTSGEEGNADGFVVGESPMFIVQAATGTYMIHNHDSPYWEDMDEIVDQIGELRLRKAVSEHRAWLSVDLIVPKEDESTAASLYPPILQLILEMADEDTLAIFRPETTQVNVWSDSLAERLKAPNAYEMFAEQDNAPVVPISRDDPNLVAAVATARERWPEFVSAFHAKSDDDSEFNAKAKITVGETTEFIWLEVIGLEPKYLHGRLANDPVDLGDLKIGSQVEVPIDDVQDWCYIKDGAPVGLFSVEAIQTAQEEFQRQADSDREV